MRQSRRRRRRRKRHEQECDDDPVVELLLAAKVPVNRQNWIDAAYGHEVPESVDSARRRRGAGRAPGLDESDGGGIATDGAASTGDWPRHGRQWQPVPTPRGPPERLMPPSFDHRGAPRLAGSDRRVTEARYAGCVLCPLPGRLLVDPYLGRTAPRSGTAAAPGLGCARRPDPARSLHDSGRVRFVRRCGIQRAAGVSVHASVRTMVQPR